MHKSIQKGFISCNSCRVFVLGLMLGICANVSAAGTDTDGEKLVVKHRCYPCHSASENLLGPAYEAIAIRHAANKEAMVEVLAEKIIVGGAGNWGVVPMVPNEQVDKEDARVIARWILEQNK